MQHHVDEGKHELNFSDLSQMSAKKLAHKMEEVGEQVEKHEMPLSSYTLIHTDAMLSEAQIRMLKSWAEGAKAEVQARQPAQ
jgi:hypothetical protein